ncbi:hypothetical protein ACFOY8_14365 [Thalassospira xianhensis]|uniref:Uncharacterized protein n=1 Tax=Thalassospira xianhensis MCCC 1A02616 TaxID=1177929 RepID=A0A367UJ38_9PROT|nr:hypothetical protein [Thalassospira xianhensis]RCK07663.1 hypothetical protein TH5_00895 [Thalassospira xianhensis MCCC 1A02616]
MTTSIIDVQFTYTVEAVLRRGTKVQRHTVFDTIPVSIREVSHPDDFPVSAVFTSRARRDQDIRYFDGRQYTPSDRDDVFRDFHENIPKKIACTEPNLKDIWRRNIPAAPDWLTGVPLGEFERKYRILHDNRAIVRARLLDAVSKSLLFQGVVWRSDLKLPVWVATDNEDHADIHGPNRMLTYRKIDHVSRCILSTDDGMRGDWLANDIVRAHADVEGWVFGNFEVLHPSTFEHIHLDEYLFLLSMEKLLRIRGVQGNVGSRLEMSADTLVAYAHVRDAFDKFKSNVDIIPDPYEAEVPDDLAAAFQELLSALSEDDVHKPQVEHLMDVAYTLNDFHFDNIMARKAARANDQLETRLADPTVTPPML